MPGFCLAKIPICLLLSETKGNRMGPPGGLEVKRTHCLFIDYLKVYNENYELLSTVNEMIVKANVDTRACYGKKMCQDDI